MEQENRTRETTGTEELTLEESIAKLEELLGILENRDTPLEEAFRTYQEGINLLKQCTEKLDLVEKKMQMLDEEGELHDFPG